MTTRKGVVMFKLRDVVGGGLRLTGEDDRIF